MKAGSGNAPGAPGMSPRWAVGEKTGVGTAISHHSNVWFTISRGILTEVFYPDVDCACIRDLGLLVTDRRHFFSEEQRDTDSEVKYLEPGVPAFRLTNTCKQGRYRLAKTVFADPNRSAVLQVIDFTPLKGKREDYAVFALLNPHLNNRGANNTAWVGDYKGMPMLFACADEMALALACTRPWRRRSVGFVGVSDGWQDVSRHGEMHWAYDRAEHGNVALTGEIDLGTKAQPFVLVLAFGRNHAEAGHRARAALLQDADEALQSYVKDWRDWQQGLTDLGDTKDSGSGLYRVSTTVMRVHEGKRFPGSLVASLATPWGSVHGDDDRGYHLVWPRDMIETVGGLLAARKHVDARRVLFYFRVTQDADGHWPQNMAVDGVAHWDGIQLDETAYVILLVDMARRERALDDGQVAEFWPMVRQATGYLVREGPVTPMDRWEEQAGYFASTMAVQVAALLAAADLADLHGESDLAEYLRETADAWNDTIDRLIYATDTDLARRTGVEGYYVRFARPDQLQADTPAHGWADLKNHANGQGWVALSEVVSPDALLLVRFGLRAADDPRVLNTVKVIDQTLRVELPGGPCWHRYSHDGYGEHADGSPFNGTGIGRVWPLLTGERAHYELAAGRREEAERLRHTLESFANDGKLLSEQLWDAPDIADRGLYLGKPTGSATPLVWAHAEYVKLRRSLHDGRVFDTPPQTVERYLQEKIQSPHVCWRFRQGCRAVPTGKVLRLEVLERALIRWTTDGWKTVRETPTRPTGLGIHLVDLPTADLAAGTQVEFTFLWLGTGHWEGRNFQVTVQPGAPRPPTPGHPAKMGRRARTGEPRPRRPGKGRAARRRAVNAQRAPPGRERQTEGLVHR